MTTLDRARFEHLYLNANSIAEIAFLRALDAAASAPVPEPTPEQRAAAEALAKEINNPDPANFNWAALEGIYGFDGPLDAAPPPGAADVQASEPVPPNKPTFDEIVGWDEDADIDAPLDIPRYLERVEEARPSLQARVSDCFARADIAALEAALATLPADAPPLTSALAPDAFMRWLGLYESHHEGLQAAVLGIRRLEPLFPA
jgi:hypothetical protein